MADLQTFRRRYIFAIYEVADVFCFAGQMPLTIHRRNTTRTP